MLTMKNILHISDIHASAIPSKGVDSITLEQTAKLLIKDISELGLKIDTIVITGDIAQHGTEDEYEMFDRVFLDAIRKEFTVGNERIFITPGNHDVNRSLIDKTYIWSRSGVGNDVNELDLLVKRSLNKDATASA